MWALLLALRARAGRVGPTGAWEHDRAEEMAATEAELMRHRRASTTILEDVAAPRASTIGHLDSAKDEADTLRQKLPQAVWKLTGDYEGRCYWWEIFECVRKLAVACLPVFFQPSGSAPQLICAPLTAPHGPWPHAMPDGRFRPRRAAAGLGLRLGGGGRWHAPPSRIEPAAEPF